MKVRSVRWTAKGRIDLTEGTELPTDDPEKLIRKIEELIALYLLKLSNDGYVEFDILDYMDN